MPEEAILPLVAEEVGGGAMIAETGLAGVGADAFTAETGLSTAIDSYVGDLVGELTASTAPVTDSPVYDIAPGDPGYQETQGLPSGDPAAREMVSPPAESNTQKLAQQVLNGSGPEVDPSDVTRDPSDVMRGANGANATPPAQKGIIDSAVDWATKNPMPAAMLGQTVAGAVGGAGKAALEKEIQQRNIKARSDLITQQSEQQLAQSQAGTYTGAPGVKPSGQKVLMRPDGTPVFANGIINRQTG